MPGPQAMTGQRTRILTMPATWHWVTLLFGGLLLLYINRGQWFFQDEWGFLAERSITFGSQGLFEPHNEHWSTTPILLYAFVFHTFGMTSYVPYASLAILAHLVVVHLVWRTSLSAGVEPWMATVFCAAFLPFGPGADNLLWGFQVGFVGSIAVGLAAILLEDEERSSRARLAARWAASTFALTFSAISVPVVAGATVTAWMRRGLKAFAVSAIVPVLVFLAWFLSVGRSGLGAVPVTGETLASAPAFFVTGLGAALSLGTPWILTGLIPLGLAGIAVTTRSRRGGTFPYAAVGAAIGELLLLTLFAVGRSGLGPEAGSATRYVYMAGALFLPLMLVGLSDFTRRRKLAAVLATALALPWGLNNARLLLATAEQEEEREQIVREQYLAAGRLFERGDVLLPAPEPFSSPKLDLEEVKALLPLFDTGTSVRREAVMRAALAMQVSVTPAPRFEGGDLSAMSASQADLVPSATGCVHVTPTGAQPQLLIPSGPPSSYALMPDVTQELQIFLSEAGLTPDYATRFEVGSGRFSYLNVAVDSRLLGGSMLEVVIASPVRLCEPGSQRTAL